MAQLTLERVTKHFGPGAPAIDDVSLSVEAGSFLALLGPSGCGKTTLLRMIAGFEAPTAGTIRLGGRVLAGPGTLVAPEARNMAMVFQSYALWPHMDVAANIGYPLKLRGLNRTEREARVAAALQAVRMAEFADRRPETLSGGQRQRVALARCLVSDPEAVLLDEPLANLDRHLRAAMEDSFRDFHRRTGATMVYVTHDQAEAMALADRIAVMAGGRLLQLGAPDEIYRRPASRAVAELIGHGAVLSLALPPDAPRDLDPGLLSRALAGETEGPRAEVFVRPEDVVLCPDPTGPAQISASIYTGERHALALRTGCGQAVKAYAPFGLAAGTRVACRLLRGWRV